MLPNTDIAGAKKLAERILSSLIKNVLRIESRIINVALSIGIVQYPVHGSDEKELMDSLNKMRYRSKELGGNTIAVPQK
jgi:GGDEF domain-containing protein